MNTKIVEGAIVSVFPKAQPENIRSETKLGELPGWDSMNAVNLQVELEGRLGITDLGIMLDSDLTVGQLSELIGRNG